MIPKKFERKCQWCGRSFNHWKSHWHHQNKCQDDGPGFDQACDTMIERKQPTEAEVFKGFTDADGEREAQTHSAERARAEGRTEELRKRLLPTRRGED